MTDLSRPKNKAYIPISYPLVMSGPKIRKVSFFGMLSQILELEVGCLQTSQTTLQSRIHPKSFKNYCKTYTSAASLLNP